MSTVVAMTINWWHIRDGVGYNVQSLRFATTSPNHCLQPVSSCRSRIKGRQANKRTGEQCGIAQCGLLEDSEISGMLKASFAKTYLNDSSLWSGAERFAATAQHHHLQQIPNSGQHCILFIEKL